MSVQPGERRARALLWLGMLVGIALTAVALVRGGGAPSAPDVDAVALVNGEALAREAFDRLEAAVAEERRRPLDAAARRHLLERMVDEELLLQRGLALGLQRLDPVARRAIVRSVIDGITASAELEEPDDAELRRFYEDSPERFRRSERLVLDAARVAIGQRSETAAFRRASDLAARLRGGEPFEQVSAELADPTAASLPAGPLPPETLTRYLGPRVAAAAERLQPGEVSDPIRGGDGWWVLGMRERASGTRIPFEEIRDQVRSEYLRRAGERALREVLRAAREEGDVRILDADLREP